MAYALNPFTANLDYYQPGFVGTFAVAPVSAQNGNTYLNSTSNTYWVWFAGGWQLLATFSISNSFLLLESADYILLESGDKLVLEI